MAEISDKTDKLLLNHSSIGFGVHLLLGPSAVNNLTERQWQRHKPRSIHLTHIHVHLLTSRQTQLTQ